MREFDRQLAAQKEANAKLKARNDALDADVRDLKTGSEAIEERARSELGMVKQDEVFFQLRQRPESRAQRARRRSRGVARRHHVVADPAGAADPRKSADRASLARRGDANADHVRRPVNVQHVTSRHNPRLREAAALIASSRERRKSGKCVLEGEHVIATYVQRHGAPETLIVTRMRSGAARRPRAGRAPLAAHARRPGVASGVDRVAAGERRACWPSSTTPQPAPLGFADFCLLVDDVQDPGNVGSMLRSAAAAGVAQVLLSKHCAFAWSPKVLRAGQGAHFCVDIHEDVDLAGVGRAAIARPAATSSPRSPPAGRRSFAASLGQRGSRWPSATKARDSRPSSRHRRPSA